MPSPAPAILGTAESFTVLGGSTVTNTGPTTVVGDLGVSPGLAVTGFPPGTVSGGVIHAGDAPALQAQNDLVTAYNDLAGRSCTVDLTGQDLGGMTLLPGVYCFSSSAQLTGTLTLDAAGDPDAVFIFQVGSTLTTASSASVLVKNQAQPCNVYWQIGSSATLGTAATVFGVTGGFVGTIVALTSITLTTGVQVNGRALARNGAVTMDTNHLEVGVCDVGGEIDAGQVTDASATDASATDASVTDAGAPIDGSPTDAPRPDAYVEYCGTNNPIDLYTDRDHCGECDHACTLDQVCLGGQCRLPGS